MNAVDGTGLQQLTDFSSDSPEWSPDGTKIAFNAGGEISTMNADGSDPTNVTNNPADDGAPVFSPDGNQIVFHSNRSGGYEIHVMNSDGTGVITQLTSTGYNVQPHWSPSGDRIVFESPRDTSLPSGLYVMNSDGSNPTRLTNNTTTDSNAAWRSGGAPLGFEMPLSRQSLGGGTSSSANFVLQGSAGGVPGETQSAGFNLQSGF